MPAAMGDDRLIIAIGRLERALARLESVGRAPAAAPAAGADGAAAMARVQAAEAELARLRERHERLRTGAAAALAGLDRLIAEQAG